MQAQVRRIEDWRSPVSGFGFGTQGRRRMWPQRRQAGPKRGNELEEFDRLAKNSCGRLRKNVEKRVAEIKRRIAERYSDDRNVGD